MQEIPNIVVQLVHIEGPLKGEIIEISEPEILIGRHPQCHLLFPRDLTIISRKHARIVREGNRFKLIDQSTNGTYVNGKRVQESFLKNGDVLMIADGGPKVSFLTKITGNSFQPSHPEPVPIPPKKPIDVPSQPSLSSNLEPRVDTTQVPLAVQYGPTLRSFKKLPITIGKSTRCDVTINYPAILDLHAEIFFNRNQYWVKDLTGQNRVSVNGAPLRQPVPLTAECLVSLSPQGPSFRFLEGGRLVEIEESNVPNSKMNSAPLADKATGKQKDIPPSHRSGGIIKKFFKS